MPLAAQRNFSTGSSFWPKVGAVAASMLLLRFAADIESLWLGSFVVSAIASGMVALVLVSAAMKVSTTGAEG